MLKNRLIHLSGVRHSRKEWFQMLLPHLIAVAVFFGVAAWYCKPVFDNKVLMQEDVVQWRAMAQNSFQYGAQHGGELPLWSNGMFSGMPAFQIAMDGRSVDLPSFAYNLLTLWLKKPVSFFFLACLSFYFLAGVLRINPYIGMIGALCYAYATYNPVIVAVGHETKMQTIALMPSLIGSLILIFERKHWGGMALTALCMSMMISFGHMQIVYYIFLAAAVLFINYTIRWAREKDFRHIYQTAFMAVGACVIGILCNSIMLFTTYDSSKETTRGGSELADKEGNISTSGLSETAAFDFSMYKSEPLVMLVPDIFGGSTDREVPEGRSKAMQLQSKMPDKVSQLIGEDGPQYYWGGVGSLFAGPPYTGAIICFLALVGLFILDNRHKWWILAACVLTIMMSWGSYFQPFNGWLLKYLPGYNKFRAPSMILVVPTFLLCMMAVMTLQKVWQEVEWAGEGRVQLWRKYRLSLLATVGLLGVLLALYAGFDYRSEADGVLLHEASLQGNTALHYMQSFVDALKDDRRMLFLNSITRSFLFIGGAALLIGWYIKRRLHAGVLVAGIGILAFVDVMSMDLLYLNNDSYQEQKTLDQSFAVSNVDRTILRDKSYYRVLDIRDSVSKALSYGAMTAYFHHSIGGYHAAKLRIYDDLITHQLFNYPNCGPVINMLNTKYIIRQGKSGADSVYKNPGSLGPVWFVRAVKYAPNAQAVMNGLTHLHPRDTAILFSADQDKVWYDADADTSGSITLLKNDNDVILYRSQSASDRFAVFSEIFYDRGWRAWIDNREVPIVRTNYVLRGLSVPAGKHVIRFAFRPASYYLGRQVQWMASILLILIVIGAIVVALHDNGIDVLVLGHQLLKNRQEPLPSV